MHRIYLDYAATTPLSDRARDAMLPWLTAKYGNPSSLHEEGRQAQAALDQAREVVSASLECEFAECIFTSSGTEAANLAIVGLAFGNQDASKTRVLVSSIEHHCVLHTGQMLERLGYSLELIPVGKDAIVDLQALAEMLDERVLLVSVMHANNEVGTLQPVKEISDLAHQHDAKFHCDAVQTYCKVPVGLTQCAADLVSVSAHKVSGPKGVGALAVRGGTKLKAPLAGGSQERELRAGTQNVAGIVGFGQAVSDTCFESQASIGEKRDRFKSNLVESLGAIPTVSDSSLCLAGHNHMRFPGVQNETLLIRLDRMGISVSAGAACSAGSIEPSHVLLAMGHSFSEAKEGIRFTLGSQTTDREVEEASERVIEAVNAIRRR